MLKHLDLSQFTLNEKIYIENSVFEDMNCILNVAMDTNSLTKVYVKKCQLKAVENVV